MDAVYQANGIIKFEPYMKLKLNASVIFDSPYGNKIMLSSTSDNDMNVEIILQPGTEEDTKEIAALELKRICDLLSYSHNIAIMESRITGMAVETVTPEGKHIKTIDTAISIDVRLSICNVLNSCA